MSSNVQAALFLLLALPLAWFLLTSVGRLTQRMNRKLDEAAAAPDAAGDDFVRLVGFGTVLMSAGLFFFGADWRVFFVPVPWFAAFTGAVGAWAMTFPSKYRELRKRNRQ